MKLHELGAQRPTDQIARVLANHLGKTIDFGAIGPRRAQGMLASVQQSLREHRNRVGSHQHAQDGAYLQLVMLEQALQSRIREQETDSMMGGTTGAAIKDPKAKAVMDKVTRGQTLTPDEQMTVNKIALTKKESRRPRNMVREQSEIQTAQVVLAAQDMVDRVQGMLEDISEMQFKDLPALANSVKNDMGTEQATQFQSAASAALTQLLTGLQAGKTELEAAQGILTGQAPVVPGQEPAPAMAATAPAGDAGGDIEGELDLDVNLDTDEEEPETGAALGRERR